MTRCSSRSNRPAVLALAALLCASAGCASARRAGPAAVPESDAGREKPAPAGADGNAPPPEASAPASPGESSNEGGAAGGKGSAGAGEAAGAGEPAGTGTLAGDGTRAARPETPTAGAGWVIGAGAADPRAGEKPGADRPQSTTGGGARTSGAAATGPAPADPDRAAAAGGLVLRLSAGPSALQVGDEVTVEVRASTLARVVDAPLHLDYDATRLRYVDGEEGNFLNRDGSGTVFLINGRSLPGVVTIGLGRLDREHGLSGAGTHCRVRFEVIAAGRSRLAVGQAMAWADDGRMIPVGTDEIEIDVPASGP